MKSYIVFSVLLIVVLLIGCAKEISNKQIIEEVQRCEVSGLDARQLYDIVSGLTVGVECIVPKGEVACFTHLKTFPR